MQRGLDGIGEALDSISPHIKGQIDRVLSGGLFQAEANAHREEEVNRLLTSARQRNKPQSRRLVKGPAFLSDTGYLTVKDTKRHINRRGEKEKHQVQGRKRRHQ